MIEPKKGTIHSLPKSKRPREKLIDLGVANLTNAELLAVILGSGTQGRHVVKVAKEVLKKVSLKNLAQSGWRDLVKVRGIGVVQASRILASLELGKRALKTLPGKRILTPASAVEETGEIAAKSREYLVALYLNARRELVQKQTITIGNLNQNIVEPRDVFGLAVVLPCANVILVHNHPSGDPNPTSDDKKLTRALVKAGDILGIQIVDHIIVAKQDYFSFREAKLL